MIDLTSKKALVTGSAQGIGLAIAKTLAKAGASIILSDINEEQLEKSVNALKEEGLKTESTHLDITDLEEIGKVMQAHQPDILVCNAGVANDKKAEDYTDEDWQKMMDLNLNGTFYCCRDAGKEMIKKGGGTIINIASIAGVAVVSPEHHIGYDVAKAGVIQLTRTLGVNWAKHNIRVNSISPGYTDTKILDDVGSESPETLEKWRSQIPNGKFNQPEDIASAVLFLASDLATGVNATNLMVDGGYSVSQ